MNKNKYCYCFSFAFIPHLFSSVKIMEVIDFEELEIACVETFKWQGDHDKAFQLLLSLQQPAAVRTSFNIIPHIRPDSLSTDVSLVHLAALNGWMDIVAILVDKYGCSSQCCDSDGQTPLHYAAYDGNLTMVKYLIIEQTCDPLQSCDDGFNSLHCACLGGCLQLVKYLISEHHCDANFSDEAKLFSLIAAFLSKQIDIVKYLITEENYNPNSVDQEGMSLLHYAVLNQDEGIKIIHYLIQELGCDPALPNEDSDMPIHIACLGGHLSVLMYLINEQQCDPSSTGQYGRTPLHSACRNGHMNIIQYLIMEQGCDPALPDDNCSMPLHIACLYGQLTVVKYLIIEQHCDPNSKGQYGRTPLRYACHNGHMDIIKYLITEHGCDPLLPDNESYMLIHKACFRGQLSLVRYLINVQHSDPNCKEKYGRTPLHHACKNGHMDVIKYLITKTSCNQELPDNDGNMPIHIACFNGQLIVVKYLITERNCDPNSRGQVGWTPLHCACKNGHMDIIQYLIKEHDCNPALPNIHGNMPIHIACFCGKLSVVMYLIAKQNCDPNSRGQYGKTPLHCACQNGHMDIIRYLITDIGCDPTLPDSIDGAMPIHIACVTGQLGVVKYLLAGEHCSPNSESLYSSRSPLRYACRYGHINIIKYLIKEVKCDPAFVNSDRRSLLHSASQYGHTHVVQWLLQDERVDALCKDVYGRTPVDLAELSDNSYELLNLFKPLLRTRNDYPIHSFSKAVLTGNSGAGKSSLAQFIVDSATQSCLFFEDKNEEQAIVETLTAGIDSYVIKSEKIGNIVLKSEEEIMQAVHYWFTFIENATSKTKDPSCIVIIGSHTDLLHLEELLAKTTLVEDLMERRVKKLKYEGFVGMDCRRPSESSIEKFFPVLTHCQSIISTYSPPVSVYCHMLYSFLQTKLNKKCCQFDDLISHFSTKEESLIPPNKTLLSDLLEYLGDKGLIIYLKNNECSEKSWVVVKREVILKDINGVLFKPKYFRGYRPIASSTGIIRVSSLSQLFPQYDPEMLVQLMIRLEFCCPVNLSDVKTNLTPIDGTGITDINLFFPCLLSVERPQALTSEIQQSSSQQVCFGWCLGCMDYEYHFLTSRFLHVLLLRLAYTFPLPSKGYSKSHNLYGLEKRCIVWTNGISWNNNNGIRTVVEVIQQNRWVVVAMYHNKDITRPVEYSKHRSAVIRLVLELQKELAPDLDTLECLISPSLLRQSPLDHLHESDLFTIADVASSILRRNSSVLSYKYGSKQLSTERAVHFEPYHLLSPSSVCDLMDSSKSDQPVSSGLLYEVKDCCQLKSQSHLSLKKHLDSMSIFTGRNPLVST